MTGSPDRDELYGAYLDELLGGKAIDPALYLNQAGVVDDNLLGKLRALYLAAKVVPEPAAPHTTAEGDELPFERLGDFRLLRRLGEGGMGTVYLAEQESLGRQVALKVIRPELFGSGSTSQRFQSEARSLARLQHPGVVTIFDFGVEQGIHYLAMEQVPGLDLGEYLQQMKDSGDAVPPSKAVRWTAEVARALQSVHDAGILHRDIKASNIRITPEGKAVLVDFGLAIEQGSDGPTRTKSFIGSPAYASPEQIRGTGSVDPRADVYSLGITLYRCITGILPFQADDLKALFRKILETDPIHPKVLVPGIPKDLDVVILHAMEKDRERRYQSAAELADDLDAVLEFRPIKARPPSRWRRLQQWTRQHRASAATLLTGAIAVVVGAIFLAVQAGSAARSLKDDAAQLVKSARVRVQEFVAMREEMSAQEIMVDNIQINMESNFLPAEQLAILDGAEDEVRQASLQRERLFHQVLDQLDLAQSLDPEVADADAVRAELYLTRYLESELLADSAASTFYLEQGEHFDDGTTLSRLQAFATLNLNINPPGPVQIYSFVFPEQSELIETGDHRVVPAPDPALPESTGVIPGTWCQRVLHDQGELRREDLIFNIEGSPIEGSVWVVSDNIHVRRGDRLISADGIAIAGGFEMDLLRRNISPDGFPEHALPAPRHFLFARGDQTFELESPDWVSLGIDLALPNEFLSQGNCVVEVYRDGVVQTIRIEAGVATQITSVPLLTHREGWTDFPPGPISLEFEPGLRLILVRRPGFEDFRLPMTLSTQQEINIDVQLHPLGTTPDGYRLVVPGPEWNQSPYWLKQTEVTSSDYLKFLNHPATLAKIQNSAQHTLFPRTFDTAANGGLWPKNADDTYALPNYWPSDWPIFGVSWFDAVAYAEWRTEQAQAAGLPHKFRLPTLSEFRIAGRGMTRWAYPYGSRYRPNWSNGCFSRPRPNPEPVLRYPVDESIFGIFDCSGSALEWLDAWWNKDQTQRFAGGGSWAQGGSTAAKTASGLGMLPNASAMETSFRLVLEIHD
jgi:protein kinase-like protein/sulfatase-modifying factor enzyme 1